MHLTSMGEGFFFNFSLFNSLFSFFSFFLSLAQPHYTTQANLKHLPASTSLVARVTGL